MGSSLNQRAAEFSICNTLVLLLDLAFKQSARNSKVRGKIRLVPHVIAPMLLGSKGEKRRVTGQRWEEPDSQPSHTNSPADLLKIGLCPS